MSTFQETIPKIAFLFVIFVVIAGGYVTDILSCQMQHWLSDSFMARHIVGVLLIFFFIMLEGGWDFNQEENDKAPVDWSSGNTVHTSVYAVFIYIAFVFISNSRLIFNLLTFGALFILYYMNSYKNYLMNRGRISKEQAEQINKVEIAFIVISAIFAVIGFIDYVIYQKRQRGRGFSWIKLFGATLECDYAKEKKSASGSRTRTLSLSRLRTA